MDKINLLYLNQKTRAEIQKTFHLNKELPSVQLQQFFTKEVYEQLCQAVVSGSFRHEKIPHLHSYSVAEIPAKVDAFFSSSEFLDFFSLLLPKKIKISFRLYSFSWRDYILLNDQSLEKPGIDLIFDLTSLWDSSWGGNIVYVDGTGEYTMIAGAPNTLTIVQRKKNVRKFVQYVNHYAEQRKRYLLMGTLR
ncbi:hypothetical protein HYX14_04835 [Candidatus Woesearchaeota archaeon]|nr:hypothetical protein [Candidatus Woesearchaeota archaeon]